MQPERISKKSEDKYGIRMGWITFIIFAVLIIWIIYTASQTQTVETGSDAMPANMPGMIQTAEADESETPPTDMPDDMSGMEH